MTTTVFVVFVIVYVGMFLGGLPLVKLDRTGVALLGAIALIAFEAIGVDEAAKSVDVSTIVLLFSFMVVSAQLRLGGFYDWVTRRLGALEVSAPRLLAALMTVVAALSAIFSNDIICLAVAPVLIDVCHRRAQHAMPFLIALACAANIGSAATLIGNPQNILIGQALHLPFAGYTVAALPVVALSLIAAWAIVAAQARGRWTSSEAAAPVPGARAEDAGIALDRWQTAKGLAAGAILLAAFVLTPWPRESVALTGAGVLLMSRRFHSTRVLGLVDWELLVLFIGLFVVNHALQATGLTASAIDEARRLGVDLTHPGPLFVLTFVLSNVVSNVPAVMLLLPTAVHPLAGPMLALVSTLAGNLLIVGSIANIIVVDAAARRGIRIDWREHARIGIPVTAVSLAITASWLALRIALGR
jgi:Na+/H+ antiporter NhaD/arsenite permease-like protein